MKRSRQKREANYGSREYEDDGASFLQPEVAMASRTISFSRLTKLMEKTNRLEVVE
jgi:hypothetical protein